MVEQSHLGTNADRLGHEAPSPLLERLIFFSDAVFAIAITLLIIEVKVPHLGHQAGSEAHLQELARLIPSFVGFFISFAVIGAFWSGHHRAFGLARHYAPGLLLPNLAMLCAIVFMPFSTAYMASNYGEVVPTALYNALLLITGLLNLHLVRKVTGAPYVSEAADPEEVAITRVRGWGVTIAAALALVVSFIAAPFAQVMLATSALWILLAIRRARKAHAARRA
jgi:uncharacterized membrane protein